MNVIELNNVSKSFGTVRALNNLTLTVPEGSIFGFLGPNGAGKTTTIKILLRLIKEDGGTINLFGEKIDIENIKKRKRIGFVPEEFSLYNYMTGWEILRFNAGLFGKKNLVKIDELQDTFHLPLREKISTYSRGMKKALSLYIALSTGPELLILDEPTDGLDPVVRKRLLDFLIKEVAEKNITIFFSSHILSEVEKICDTVAIIKKGKVIAQEELGKIKENANLITVRFSSKIDTSKLEAAGITSISKIDESTFDLKLFKNSNATVKKIEDAGGEVVRKIPLSFEDIFMHFMEEKNVATH